MALDEPSSDSSLLAGDADIGFPLQGGIWWKDQGHRKPSRCRPTSTERTTFVRLSGELDMATAPALQEALHAAQHAETSHVIVDLRQLTFLDSFGLRILAAADIAGRDGHVKVSFIGGSDSVHGVFELTEMDKRVDCDAPV